MTTEQSQQIVFKRALGDPSGTILNDVASIALPLRTELVNDDAGFDRLAREWDALLAVSGQQVFFLRYGWTRSWWRLYAPRGSRLYIICCRDANGRLVGLAPLYLRRHRLFGVPYLRELTFIGMGIELKTSEFMDVIAHRGSEERVARAIVTFLRRRDDWDRLWLHQVPSESRCLGHVVESFDGSAAAKYCDRAPYIDTSVSWESYRHSLGRSMRRNVEYYARRLFKQRRCVFGRAATREEAATALDALVRLHQLRWQSAGQPGSFSDPMLHQLLGDAVRDQFDAGRLLLWTLRIDGEIQAALLGFLDNGVLHYFQKGFNPAFAKDDIGTALLGLCLRDSFEDPAIRVFDFMGGGAGYKELWARNNRVTTTCVADRYNLRTHVHAAREKFREASATAFRKLAPVSLRVARRDFIRARIQRQWRVTRENTTQLALALSCYAADALGILSPFFASSPLVS